jgi:hypothetical protein
MATLRSLKASLTKDIATYSLELVSFDRVFDEDILIAKQEQWMIVKDEIDRLEMCLMSLIIERDHIHYTETVEFSVIADKITVFHDKEIRIQKEIEDLNLTREQLYNKWKKDYLTSAENLTQAQTKLRKIHDVESSLTRLYRKNIYVRNDVLTLVHLHNQINALLSFVSIKKERSPYKAFQVAWHHKLIDDATYDCLQH